MSRPGLEFNLQNPALRLALRQPGAFFWNAPDVLAPKLNQGPCPGAVCRHESPVVQVFSDIIAAIRPLARSAAAVQPYFTQRGHTPVGLWSLFF